ncbi:hypothetical protein [Streptomyces sp. NPDC059893]|uniref:hypothetical protein n=1 Tax=Streptomyces sp. NPDC059893 TaxID=3346990 RepID=UPI00365E110B
MNFHTITYQGKTYFGPPEYAREDQEEAGVLFRDMLNATTLHPNNPAGVTAYMVKQMLKPGVTCAPYAEAELMRHLQRLERQFRAAYAAHSRHESGPTPPPPPITEPTHIPEKIVPGQRKELVDPNTGEVITVMVPADQAQSTEPVTVDNVAVVINAARTYCYETRQDNERRIHALSDLKIMEEARRHDREVKNERTKLSRHSAQLAKFNELLDLVAAARPKHDEDTSVESIVRAEEFDIRSFGLTYRKLREFLQRFEHPAEASA